MKLIKLCNIFVYFSGQTQESSTKWRNPWYTDKLSNTSCISTSYMETVLDRLRNNTRRDYTKKNYHTIWKCFSKFVLKLDVIPNSWEDRLHLFGAYMINKGTQSSTLKSYFSAIKAILKDDGFKVHEEKMFLSTLSRACKLSNDCVTIRLPIHAKLLEVILFELSQIFHSQPYLEVLYQTLFALVYYMLFWVSELTTGGHPILARDVHIAHNKEKILVILRSSKTHGRESYPQKVKITAHPDHFQWFFCLFQTARRFLSCRGNYLNDIEPFFVFRNHIPVKPQQARETLKKALINLNIDFKLYNFHSFRIGRSSDMIKWGATIEQVKLAG